MGCSLVKAKKILYKLKATYGEITEEMLGMAIQEVRNRQDLRRLNGSKKTKRRVLPSQEQQS